MSDNSEPAFPSANEQYFGISMRDYFAAKAMAALLSNEAIVQRHIAAARDERIDPDVLVSTSAYSIADAMIAERAK